MNVTDLFDRADNPTDLGANYAQQRTGGANLTIASQRVKTTTNGYEGVMQYTAAAPTDPQFSETVAGVFAGGTNMNVQGATTRATTPGTASYYYARMVRADHYFGGHTTQLAELTNNSETILAYESSTTWAATDTIRLESVGNAHNIYRNGSGTPLVSDADDNTHTTGGVGIYMWGEDTANNLIETWRGGDVVAPAVLEQTHYRFRADDGPLIAP